MKLLEVEGRDVPQCPIHGDATARVVHPLSSCRLVSLALSSLAISAPPIFQQFFVLAFVTILSFYTKNIIDMFRFFGHWAVIFTSYVYCKYSLSTARLTNHDARHARSNNRHIKEPDEIPLRASCVLRHTRCSVSCAIP